MVDTETLSTQHWLLIAELPFEDLQPAYQQVRKLRHVLIKRFDERLDDEILFAYRGYHFCIKRCNGRLEILVNDPECPADVLLEPISGLIPPLSRCSMRGNL